MSKSGIILSILILFVAASALSGYAAQLYPCPDQAVNSGDRRADKTKMSIYNELGPFEHSPSAYLRETNSEFGVSYAGTYLYNKAFLDRTEDIIISKYWTGCDELIVIAEQLAPGEYRAYALEIVNDGAEHVRVGILSKIDLLKLSAHEFPQVVRRTEMRCGIRYKITADTRPTPVTLHEIALEATPSDNPACADLAGQADEMRASLEGEESLQNSIFFVSIDPRGPLAGGGAHGEPELLTTLGNFADSKHRWERPAVTAVSASSPDLARVDAQALTRTYPVLVSKNLSTGVEALAYLRSEGPYRTEYSDGVSLVLDASALSALPLADELQPLGEILGSPVFLAALGLMLLIGLGYLFYSRR